MISKRPTGLIPMMLGAVLALLIAYVATGWLEQDNLAVGWGGTVTVDGTAQVSAGSDATIVVAAAAPDGTTVQLGVFAPVNSTLLTATLDQGAARFVVDGQSLEHAGLYRVVAQVDQGESEVHALRVTPLDAVDPVVPLVGPRTILANGEDVSMTVVTPTDRFGNPVEDGTPVDFEVVRPRGETSMATGLIDRALAAILIEATTETGRVTVSTSVGDIEGPSNAVDQVAGIPGPFTVQIDSRNTLADGFALHSIETSELRDRFGNLLPDGVSAVFVVQDSAGTSFLQAVVQGGVARTMFEAPNMPGTTTLTARVSGVESAPIDVDFAPAVASLVATRTPNGDQSVVMVGPVIAERGGYVPDGTMVTIRDLESGEQLGAAAVLGGFVDIVIGDAADVDVEVTVLGISVIAEES